MKKNIYLVFLFLALSTACSQKLKTHDPLTTYWQHQNKQLKQEKINKEIKLKLKEIEKQINKLKEPSWHQYVNSIYSNIQIIRNKKIKPLPTTQPDDI
mgnify:CR=1 FL=1|tara:strand:+ start:3993 stop:4286 length:294 start_codon:yes stop_codon:yes gene_type:complete